MMRKQLIALGLGVGLAAGAPWVMAEGNCGENPECLREICHNIGGPRDLGANCDTDEGVCQVLLDTGATLDVYEGYFLGIVIPPKNGNALAAHIAHGDGPLLATFDPPLHLASTGQNHAASNVECLGARLIPQPPDHGN